MAPTSAVDFGAVSAELDALAAMLASRLPAALLQPSAAAAGAAGVGGDLVLFELPVNCEGIAPSGPESESQVSSNNVCSNEAG